MSVYQNMIDQIALEIAIKAEALLSDRVNGLGQRMLMKAFVDTPEFVNAVRGEFPRLLESDDFTRDVKSLAEDIAEEAAEEAIEKHERNTDHLATDDVVDSREFERAIEEAVDEMVKDKIDEELASRFENLEDDEMLLERLATMFSQPATREDILRVIATGKFDLEEHRARIEERKRIEAAERMFKAEPVIASDEPMDITADVNIEVTPIMETPLENEKGE